MDSSGPGRLVWAEWRQRIASRSAQAQQRWRNGWQPRLRKLFAVQHPAQPEPAPKSGPSPKSELGQVPALVKQPDPAQDTAFLEKEQESESVHDSGPAHELEPETNSEPGPTWELKQSGSSLEPEQKSETVQAELELPSLQIDDCGGGTVTAMMATDATAESSDGSESRASAVEPSLRAGSALGGPLLAVPVTTPEGSVSSARRSPLTVQDWVDSLPATPCPREVSGGGESSGRGAALAREASLASEAGSQSSVESLLGLRRADPEEVLLGLGFGGAGSDLDDDLARIPRRFLRPSQVRGVAIHDFLRHQHDLVHVFESSTLGYRGLAGTGSRPAAGIVGKIMEKLRGQRPPFPLAAGNARFAAAARRVINTLPVTVLSPGNREYLDQQGGKSPEVPRKRMVIGQRSFAFDREGHLIDLGSDSGSDGGASSLSRSDTLGSEPLARRLSFPVSEAPSSTPDAPPSDTPGGWSPVAQRRRRSLKRQPRIDDRDETSPEDGPSIAASELPNATSTPTSRAPGREKPVHSSLGLIDTDSKLTLEEASDSPVVASKPLTEAANESLDISQKLLEPAIDPLVPVLTHQEPTAESKEPLIESPDAALVLETPVSKWLKRDSESLESSPHSLEWDLETMEPLVDAPARRDSGRNTESLYLRERAAMHQVPQLRILVDTVVERHSVENRRRPDSGLSEEGSPCEVSPREEKTQDDEEEERDTDVSAWDESMAGDIRREAEMDADWALRRGGGRLQALIEESEFGSDTNSVSSSVLEEALIAGDPSAARRARLAGLGPSDSSGFSDQEDSLDQLSQELKRRGVEPGACAAKAALAAFGAALSCAAGCAQNCADLREACPDLLQLRELRDAVAMQLRRVADLVDEQPDGVPSVTAQIAELLRRQSRLARLPDACEAGCCDSLLVVSEAHRNLESLVQRNSHELAEIRRLLQQLLPAQSQS